MNYGKLVDGVLAGVVTPAYWRGEVGELWEEICSMNLAGIREEWSDVTCLGIACLITYFGVRPLRVLPIFPGMGLYAARKFEARLHVWRWIFEKHGVEFGKRHLIHGGNFARDEKVERALRSAGYEGPVNWVLIGELRKQFALRG